MRSETSRVEKEEASQEQRRAPSEYIPTSIHLYINTYIMKNFLTTNIQLTSYCQVYYSHDVCMNRLLQGLENPLEMCLHKITSSMTFWLV